MTHPILVEALNSLSLGFPQTAANLAMFPLCGPDGRTPDYLTLDEALARGLAEVSEVSEHGSVPELNFLNKAGEAVLLLDGEELVGAKQNRVLNLTILVAAKSALQIPVSCVERGRWSYRSRSFSVSGRALHARARAEKAAAVSESLAYGMKRAANQGALWDEIARKSDAMNVRSATEAMTDLHESRAKALDDLRKGLQMVPGQVGAVFAINGRIAGLELFDSPETCRKQLPKFVDSYAMDALENPAADAPKPPAAEVSKLINELKCMPVQAYKAIGLGEDLRLEGGALHGAALVALDRIVHLSAYTRAA